MNQGDMIELEDDLDRMADWASENGIKINPAKSNAIRFTKPSANDTLN
jgi:hypothetical protein